MSLYLRSRPLGILLAVAIAAAGGAFLWPSLQADRSPPGISATVLYTTQFPDLTGKPVSLGTWQGKVLLLNFCASWCAPCLEEIPALMIAQRRHAGQGLQVVGIAVDKTVAVRRFAAQLKIDYPLLIDEAGGIALAQRLGNRAGALPFSVVIDRNGAVVSTHFGALTGEKIDAALAGVI